MTGAEFKAWRIARLLTVAEASVLLGVCPRTIGNWEASGGAVLRLAGLLVERCAVSDPGPARRLDALGRVIAVKPAP